MIVLISFALLQLPFSSGRQLTEKERQLLGAWEIQAGPVAKARVVYFDDRRAMRISSPPFTTISLGRWHVDENSHLHSRREGLMETVLNIHQAPLDCEVRFSDGTLILKTSDGVKEAERSSTDERGSTQMNCKTRVVVERGRDKGLRLQTINYPLQQPLQISDG